MTFEEDDIGYNDYYAVTAELKEYDSLGPKFDEFIIENIGLPDYVINIAGYSSFIPTPYKTMKKMIDILENRKMLCLLNNCCGPIFSHCQYISKELEKRKGEKIFVEL